MIHPTASTFLSGALAVVFLTLGASPALGQREQAITKGDTSFTMKRYYYEERYMICISP